MNISTFEELVSFVRSDISSKYEFPTLHSFIQFLIHFLKKSIIIIIMITMGCKTPGVNIKLL